MVQKAKQPVNTRTYSELQDELQVVTSQLESGELSIDEALECYEKGLKLVAQLEHVLTTAENHIKMLKATYKVEG